MRINKSSQIAFALLLAGMMIGCTRTPEQKFRNQAQQIRLRILPKQATASEPVVTSSGTAFSAAWEIHSDLKRDVWESSLADALKPDFTRTNADDRLCFAKYEDGESDRLEVTFSSEVNGHTTAHVRFTISPD